MRQLAEQGAQRQQSIHLLDSMMMMMMMIAVIVDNDFLKNRSHVTNGTDYYYG
jgi:hypothetical protein